MLVGGMALYTGLILWRLFVRLDSPRYPLKSYADLADRIFGPKARHLCNILQSIQLLINVRTFSFVRCLHFVQRLLGWYDLFEQRTVAITNYQEQGVSSFPRPIITTSTERNLRSYVSLFASSSGLSWVSQLARFAH